MNKPKTLLLGIWVSRLVFCLGVLLVTTWSVSPAKKIEMEEPAAKMDLSGLVGTLREFVVNVYVPGRSEAARLMGNAIQVSEFAKVFPKGHRVEAYVIHDTMNFIDGIYPFPPEFIHGGGLNVSKTTIVGSGEWHTPRETAIYPSAIGDPDRMRKWREFARQAEERHVTRKQLAAYATAVGGLVKHNEAFEPPQISGLPPQGVKIYFDDRLLARTLGKFEQPETTESLLRLGNQIFSASESGTIEPVLRSFIDDQKAKLNVASRRTLEIRQPVLVSLRNLLARVQAPGGFAFHSLDPELKRLGGLTRVYGYVRDPEAGDIVLVGGVDPGVEPIGLDSLIVALGSVWKTGGTPMVSLDPEPGNIAGPQYVRVIGLPRDSRFALIMLNADYLMKKIDAGDPSEPMNAEGFRSLRQLLEKSPGGREGHVYSRAWLAPVQPGAGDVLMSSDENIVLFETGVQVQSEEMQLVKNILVGLNKPDPLEAEVARSFTRHYAAIERARPVYRQLHGLFDLVLLCKVWWQLGVQSRLLDTLANLPPPVEKVPDTYQGVTISFRTGNIMYEISGGVDSWITFGARQQWHQNSSRLEELRVLARRLSTSQQAVMRADTLMLSLPPPSGAESAYQDGMSAMAELDYHKASVALTRAIEEDPQFSEAYLLRAHARLKAGDKTGAEQDLARGTAENPHDPDLKLMRAMLLLEMGKSVKELGLDKPTRARVANICFEQAMALWTLRNDLQGAVTAMGKVIQLEPADADAHAFKARVELERKNLPAALADIDNAVRLDPKSDRAVRIRGLIKMAKGDNEGAIHDFRKAIELNPSSPLSHLHLADALTRRGTSSNVLAEIEMYTSLLKKDPHNPGLLIQRGISRQKGGILPGAIEDFTTAIRLAPRRADAHMHRASAYLALREYRKALSDVNEAIRFDPDRSEAYALRAEVHLKLMQPTESLRDAATAIKKDPENAQAFHVRAMAKLQLNDHRGAVNDWEEAIRLNPDQKPFYQKLIEDAKRGGQDR